MDWKPIESAPKNGNSILAIAQGDDGRPLHAIVHWTNPETMWSGNPSDWFKNPEKCEWIGEMGVRYGVPFTHWMPLPQPPQDTPS